MFGSFLRNSCGTYPRTDLMDTNSLRRSVTNHHHRKVLLAAPLLAALVLSACSGGSKPAATTGADIKATLGIDKAGMALKQTRVEELVQVCMKQAGFEYIPVDPNASAAAVVGTTGLSDDEYRKQYGYGISTIFEKVVAALQKAPASVDPNASIRSRLDTAGVAAYDKALTGGTVDVSVAGAVDAAKAGDLSGLGGCVKEGTVAVFGDSNVTAALVKIEELDKRAEADPRLVAAKEQWAKCMKDAGYDYSDPNAVDGVIQDKLAAIVGASAAKGLGEGGKFNAAAFAPGNLPAYDAAALAKLQVEELSTAQTDLACENKFVKDIDAKVKDEYQKKFAAENAALISKAQVKLGGGK